MASTFDIRLLAVVAPLLLLAAVGLSVLYAASQKVTRSVPATVAVFSPPQPAGPVTVHVALGPGFNLIGIPVILPSTTTASGLAGALLPDGVSISEGPVASVLRWEAGYEAWLSDFPTEKDFVLEPGRGYFVRLRSPVTDGKWSPTGQPFTHGVPTNLVAGFNLISVPYATPAGGYDSRSLAQAIYPEGNFQGGPVGSVLRWDSGFVAYLTDSPAEKIFIIEPGRGYFVRATQHIGVFNP